MMAIPDWFGAGASDSEHNKGALNIPSTLKDVDQQPTDTGVGIAYTSQAITMPCTCWFGGEVLVIEANSRHHLGSPVGRVESVRQG